MLKLKSPVKMISDMLVLYARSMLPLKDSEIVCCAVGWPVKSICEYFLRVHTYLYLDRFHVADL